MTIEKIITKDYIDSKWNSFLFQNYIYGYVKPVIDILRGKPRKLHCFVIGTAKSGTHSLCGMFSENFKSMHEPSFYELNKLIIDATNNNISPKELNNFYIYRDRSMALDVESNYFNYYFIDVLVKLFDNAKYIILYRNPRSWLDSWLNHTIERREIPGAIANDCLKAIFCPSRYVYDKRETILEQYNLYPLRCYLDHWLSCNKMLINAIPDERLLVLATNTISSSTKLVAEFLEVDESKLAGNKSHLFKAKAKHNILDSLDSEYIEVLIDEYENNPVILNIKNKLQQNEK